jgi:hypothetical protein
MHRSHWGWYYLVVIEIVPTILVETEEEFVRRLEQVASYVSRVQWDIVDGRFAENTSFSDIAAVNIIASRLRTANPELSIEVDLMVADPENWLERLKSPWFKEIIFHFEAKSAWGWFPVLEAASAAGFGFMGSSAGSESLPSNGRQKRFWRTEI